jgi:HK97 family phage prohead protease
MVSSFLYVRFYLENKEEIKNQIDISEPIIKGYVAKSATYDDDEGSVVGVITTSAVDRYDEIVKSDGGDFNDYRNNPIVLLNHSRSSLPIGKNEWIRSEENKILAKTKFSDDTQLARDVKSLFKNGYLNAFSIGFIPTKYYFDENDRIVYEAWKLLEYSVVTIPANQEALSLMIKSVQTPYLKEDFGNMIKQNSLEQKLIMIEKQILENKNIISSENVAEEYLTKLNQLNNSFTILSNKFEKIEQFINLKSIKENKEKTITDIKSEIRNILSK